MTLFPKDIADVRIAAGVLSGLVTRGILSEDWQPEINRLENLASVLHLHFTEQYQKEVRESGGCGGCGKPSDIANVISHAL